MFSHNLILVLSLINFVDTEWQIDTHMNRWLSKVVRFWLSSKFKFPTTVYTYSVLCIDLILLEQLNNTQNCSVFLPNSLSNSCNLSDSDVVYVCWKTADQLFSLVSCYNRGILWRSHNHITCNATEECQFVHTKSAWHIYFFFFFMCRSMSFFGGGGGGWRLILCYMLSLSAGFFFSPLFHLLDSNWCGFGLPLHRWLHCTEVAIVMDVW